MSLNGWKTVMLGDISQFSRRRISHEELNVGNYVSTENMLPNKGGKTIASSLPKGNAIEFKAGQILVSNIRPYFKKIWFATMDGGASADVLVFKPSKGIEDKYFYYLLNQDHFFNYMVAGSKGTKMPRGDKQQIMMYPLKLPPLNEQKAIAGTLSCLDDKIELNNRINNILEKIAQAIFKNWFIDFEPFQDGKFVDSELGIIPKGWKAGVLSDVANITMGQSPKGSSYNEKGDGEVFYQGRAEFGARFPTRRLYTTEPKRMASRGDVLMSVRAPVGDCNVVLEPCCIGRGLAAIQSKSGQQSFILYLMLSLKEQLDIFNGEGTVFGSINKDSLNDMQIIIPSDEVLYSFEAIAKSIDITIEKNYYEICSLRKIRDLLLPKLMSGGIRVPIKEVE
ncbi:MAG: restriction endonuclease subunit S [Alkaliphilus sp.]|nr:restriction endonuclease subunit S [Alkaliphilus sp.]